MMMENVSVIPVISTDVAMEEYVKRLKRKAINRRYHRRRQVTVAKD